MTELAIRPALPSSVADLVRGTGTGQARLSRDELAALVGSIAVDDRLWRPVVRHDPEQRWYARLHLARNVEVWLIGWEQGQDTQFHDHGGSSGAFAVVQGRLAEEYGHIERWHGVRQRTHRTGTVRSFGPAYVHNLGNVLPEPATSVHAYSPPLATMTYYRTDPQRLVPYRTAITAAPDPEVDVAQAAEPDGYFRPVTSP